MYAAFFPLVLIAVAGIGYRFVPGAMPAHDVRRVIGSVVLNVFLPALTFVALYTAPLNDALWAVPLTSAIVTLVGLGFGYVIYARLLHQRLSKPAIGALLLASAWCNATYLGLPVVTSVVGGHVQHVPILFDLLAMTPLLFIISPMLGAAFSRSRETQSSLHERQSTAHKRPSSLYERSIRQVLLLPPLWAAAAGLLCNATQMALPKELVSALEMAGRTVTPLMIFSIGLAMRVPQLGRLPLILPAVGIRLVLGTAIGWSVASLFIHHADVFKATVLESAMPTMMLTMVFAERYGLDTELLAEAIILSTICSMVTLPIIAQML